MRRHMGDSQPGMGRRCWSLTSGLAGAGCLVSAMLSLGPGPGHYGCYSSCLFKRASTLGWFIWCHRTAGEGHVAQRVEERPAIRGKKYLVLLDCLSLTPGKSGLQHPAATFPAGAAVSVGYCSIPTGLSVPDCTKTAVGPCIYRLDTFK